MSWPVTEGMPWYFLLFSWWLLIQHTISTTFISLKMNFNEIYLFQNSPVQPLTAPHNDMNLIVWGPIKCMKMVLRRALGTLPSFFLRKKCVTLELFYLQPGNLNTHRDGYPWAHEWPILVITSPGCAWVGEHRGGVGKGGSCCLERFPSRPPWLW